MANKIEEQLTASSLITAPEYMVCGVVLSSRLTAEEYARLEDYEHEHDLVGLRGDLERLQNKNSKDNREHTPVLYSAQLDKIAGFERVRDAKLQKMVDDPFAWTDEDDKYLDAIGLKIALETRKLDAMEGPDPAAVLKTTATAQRELGDLTVRFRGFHVEYCHWLATHRGLTKDKAGTWGERATAQDKANAQSAVREGKAQRNRITESKPHARQPAEMSN